MLQKRLTEEQASQNVLDTLRLERFKVMSFEPKVDQVFFETKDARDRVVYSLLRVRDEASASELFLRLDEGDATFTDLSNEHSMGPERDSGGLIGPVVLGQLHPKLSEIFRIANIDQLWGPLQIDDWWVVLRLDKKLPAVLDDKMRKLIINELFESWINERVDQFLLSYASSASDSSGA